MNVFSKIGIIGAGSYGTAIAQCFSRKIREVALISDLDITVSNLNELYMRPSSELEKNISCTNDFSSITNSDIIFITVPVMAVASVCNQIKKHAINVPIVLCSKGFDLKKHRLLNLLVEELLKNETAFFSGPSFANEIILGLPAGVNIASKNRELSERISRQFSSSSLKIKAIDDYIGLQVAGAMKNILAIGCGIFSGLELGNSAIAQLIVTGLHEMMELAVSLGGKKETFLELGGIGDIILTCSGEQSRNVLFGKHLASGGNLDNWKGSLSEGAFASKVIPSFEKNNKVKLSTFSGIYKIIYENKNPSELISEIAKSTY